MGNRFGLRTQLLLSHLILLTIALSVIVIALLLFLSARPAPTLPTYNRLAALMQGLSPRSLVQDTGRTFLDGDEFRTIMDDFAATRNVRVLWVSLQEDQPRIIYDTDNIFVGDAMIQFTMETFTSPRLEQVLLPRFHQVYGSFDNPTGEQWLFGGIVVNPPERGLGSRINANMWVLAEPRPTVSLQEVLSDFGHALLLPILQAGLVGLAVSVLLAYLTSRNIARPLQSVAVAAGAVAKGNYQQQVPISGPREVCAVAESFNRMSTEVRKAQQSQRDFLANVSHDLKTPLTSIQGYSQAIMDGATPDPGKAAKVIHDEAARLNRMVVELTDLMRIQSGRLSLKMAAVDISVVAEAIGERLAVVAEKKGITMHMNIQSTPPVAGDGDRLAQVLTNLISNAIKHTPSGGEIHISTSMHQQGVEVHVQDTGEGIPRKDLPRIFERFYQVDKTRGPQRGTGLGLAIVYEIIQAHGGLIRADSPGINQGSTFSIWLPLPNTETVKMKRSERK